VRTILTSIESEYRRYKSLAERAIAQMRDDELGQMGPGGGSSVAIIMRHIGGNLASRFTDFLTADGEKPWRDRDTEFVERDVPRSEVMEHWERGWSILFETLAALRDEHLTHEVVVRGQPSPVHEALHRSLAHTSYHVGQIVYLAKSARGDDWRTLSIPKRQA
jgi:hypothetical protein